MKINCAIIVDSIEEKESCLTKFKNLENKTFFTFNNAINKINKLKSKKNFFVELESFYKKEIFYIIHPDEELVFFDEDEALKSHFNLIVDDWVIKTRRSSAKEIAVSKIFIKSSFKNIKKFDNEWCDIYQNNKNFASKLKEYIYIYDLEPNEIFVIYQYVLEQLKLKQYNKELFYLIKSFLEKHPTFLELINLWGDYLYEINLFFDAKKCYESALKIAGDRNLYDFLPMIPSMHKTHPEKMISNIEKIISKYDAI